MFKIIENGHVVWNAETWKCAMNLFKLAKLQYQGTIAVADAFGNIICSSSRGLQIDTNPV